MGEYSVYCRSILTMNSDELIKCNFLGDGKHVYYIFVLRAGARYITIVPFTSPSEKGKGLTRFMISWHQKEWPPVLVAETKDAAAGSFAFAWTQNERATRDLVFCCSSSVQLCNKEYNMHKASIIMFYNLFHYIITVDVLLFYSWCTYYTRRRRHNGGVGTTVDLIQDNGI